MGFEYASTGKIVKMYIDENGFNASDLANASNVSIRTIIRLYNDETPLSFNVAVGLNKLIPEISTDFIVSYDSKYQFYKKELEKKDDCVKISEVISKYKMKKLYKTEASNELLLFDKAKEIFGLDNIKNGYYVDVSGLSYCFNIAEGVKDTTPLIWLKAAYEEYKKDSELLIFNNDAFEKEIKTLKIRSNTSDIKSTIYNMRSFCKKCGINFYFRPSIPGARIKAVAVKDTDGYIYIFVSDLFKCIENIWLSFVHECMHIKENDFDVLENCNDSFIDVDENYIDQKAIEFFIGADYTNDDLKDIESIAKLSRDTNTPLSITVEIARFIKQNYSDYTLNKYIHYFK